ncbi:MAG: 2-oxo acid dehydrogenase subunit E2 [Acidobacteriota bacterium]|nr:2-oxo acid dehydrogenase subunit E2 [Acidobacteriota bacterium]
MADLLIPDIGENVSGGDVVRILVNKGDTIKKDQAVLELETDKATIEVPSDQDGTITEIKVKQGDKVKIGQVILTLDAGKAEGTGQKAEEEPKAQGAEPEAESPEPKADEKAEGRSQKAEEKVVDIASRAKPAPKADAKAGADPELAAKPDATEPTAAGKVGAAPSVRRMARELGVDIARVQGSGPGGRIGADDVQAHVKAAMEGGARAGGFAHDRKLTAPLPDFSKWGEIERKPMSNIRRKTAEHLSSAWNTIPHVTQHDKADITELETLRKKHGPAVETAGGKLTVTAILLKITAAAIRKYPQFASSADGDSIVYKHYTHIGVAVDTEHGLLVPVIRDVDQKSITELSVEISKASEKARAKKLGLDDMSGGVFTVTNLGGIGGTSFTPIVNYPEVAILGVSRAVMEPVWAGEGDGFEARLMMPLSLSYDHRVIDGADAARFLRFVCDAVENPLLISL